MNELINGENKVDEMVETHFLFAKVSDRAMDLQVVENFLSTVERQFLQTSPNPFDLESFKLALDELKELPSEVSLEEFQRIEHRIFNELVHWQNTLGERSKRLETYNLRRYCDSKENTLDIMEFASLTRFYWSLPHSPSNQSKFDLFVTRLFIKETGRQPRELLLERQDLTGHLNELFEVWDDNADNSNYDLDDLQANIDKIDEFIAEANSFENFEEMVKSNLFERFRAFKLFLGKQLFEPQVTAAAIECNITVGNVFSELLAKANEPLSEKLFAKFDFAGAFHDTSPTSQTHTAKVLNDIRSKAKKAENNELKHIWTLLELVCVENETSDDLPKEDSQSDNVNAKEEPPTAQERLMPYLKTLSQPEPDTSLLLEYMRKHDSLAELDLNDFLGTADEKENLLFRNVLGVILWTQEICANELAQQKEISERVKVELQNLLEKSQNYSEELEQIVETYNLKVNPYILNVSNKLLESRLKLKHAIVRLSNRNMESSDVSKKKVQNVPAKPKAATPITKIEKPRTNRWLIAATILVALFSGAVFIFEQQMSSSIPDINANNKINIATLPASEHVQDAYLQKGTLFITAEDSWKTLSKEEQRENLQKMLNVPSKNKVSTVVIANGDGKLLGNMSAEEVISQEKPQVAVSKK